MNVLSLKKSFVVCYHSSARPDQSSVPAGGEKQHTLLQRHRTSLKIIDCGR
jgi:hypothetical protein